jgi:hypothetical protein
VTRAEKQEATNQEGVTIMNSPVDTEASSKSNSQSFLPD